MSDTPETKRALDYIYDRDGELWERNAPEKLVTLCRKLERERDEARKQSEQLKQYALKLDDWNDKLQAEVERLKADAELYSGWSKWKNGIWRISHPDSGPLAEWIAEDIDGLKADKARMDWLDSFNNTVTIQCEDGGIWIEIEDYRKVNDEPEKSLRDAIDAAMKREL